MCKNITANVPDNTVLNNSKRFAALPSKSSQSYEVSLAIWGHTVLPATRHK